MLAEENFQALPVVNRLREDVKRWRASNYENATPVTRELLRFWWRDDRPRRFFFCQLEAVETVIYLTEIRKGGKLTRFGCKMATGSEKTVVMAMLIAWALCNLGRVPSDERFPSGVLVCCPNLTVKERLQVLKPE